MRNGSSVISIIVLGIVMLTAFYANAQQQEEKSSTTVSADESLGLATHVKIEILDGIEDVCWTNSEAVSARTKLKFEQNDIKVINYKPFITSPFTFYVILNANGFRTEDSVCVGSINVQTMYKSFVRFGGENGVEEFMVATHVMHFEKGLIMTSPTNLNGQMSDFVDGAISELVSNVISARRTPKVQDMKREMKNFLEKPMSQKEAYEMIEKALSQD